jgi:hypothetical protein
MQAAGDILLGWLRVKQDIGDGRLRDYYLRQLWDAKASVAIDLLSASELSAYAETCGWTLARAHARSADRVAIGPTSARATASIVPWPHSPRSTPTRPSAITRR